MSLKEIWEKIEDAWYSFLDSLEDKGIPVYKIVDPLEARGIPSLPAFIILVLVIIAGISFLALTGPGPGAGGLLQITAKANGKALEGASIGITLGGESLGTWQTDENGIAKINLTRTGKLEISLEKEGCEPVNRTLIFNGGEIQITLKTQCQEIQPSGCLEIPEEIGAIPLLDQNGQPLKNCKVYLVSPDGITEELDWNTTQDGYLIIGRGDCLTSDDKIRIECSGYSGEFYADELLDYAESGEPLYLNPDSPEYSGDSNGNGIPDYLEENGTGWGPGTGWDETWDIDDNGNGVPDSYELDNQEETQDYMTLSVTVIDKETRQRLDGIEVRAVDSNGTLLPGNSSAITDKGMATLRIPPQKISLQAIDPNEIYSPLTTPPFFPTGFTTLALTKGFPSTIWVLDLDGRGIGGANILVEKVRLHSDSQGKAIIALPKGKEYQVYAYKEGYRPGKASLIGGENTTINLELLTDNNSGPVTIEILNPSRAGDPYPGVQIKLVSDDGIAGECKTPANGRCSWRRLYATSYQVLAKPPLAYDYEQIGKIDVKPGRDNFFSLEVNPPLVDLRVRTLVEGKPKDGVKVTLYSTYPDFEEFDKKTSKMSYAEFQAYAGNEYYLTASFMNKTLALYGSLGPFKLESRKDLVINLEKPETKLEMQIKKTLKRGSRAKAKIRLGLPYLDEKKKTNYDKVILEIWTGEPGDKLDPLASPILIDRIPELIRLSETSQIPRIGILGFSQYNERLTGSTKPGIETSKGLRITIERYKPGMMEFEIPILVRLGGLADKAKIHYHAMYQSKEQTFDTGWKDEEVKITGKTDWHEIPGGDFYLFKAGLTLDPNGKSWKPEITGTVGSKVYLHIRAIARSHSENGRVDLSIDPEIAKPVEFWGEITNGSQTWEIEKSEASKSFDIMESAMKDSLEPDDEVDLTVSLELEENGTINLIPFFDEYKQGGNPIVLKIDSKNVSWIPTPIPGVEGALINQVHFTLDDLLPNAGDEYWGTFKDNLPLFSIINGIPREFKIGLFLRNTESQSFKANLAVEAESENGQVDLGLDYPDSFSIGKGTKNIVITGIGPDEPTSGKIKIWIWQEGEEKPDKPWQEIGFESNDFMISIETNNTFEKDGEIEFIPLQDEVSEFTSSGEIHVKDYNGEEKRIEKASFNGEEAKKKFEGEEVKFIFSTGELDPGSPALVHAESDEFSLTRRYPVQGEVLNPEPGTLDPSTLDESKNSTTTKITIKNWWNDTLKIRPKLWDNYLEEQRPWLSGFKSGEKNSYNISLVASIYDKDGSIIPPLERTGSNIELQPGQTAVIIWKIEALGSMANQYKLATKLALEMEAKGSERVAEYFKNVSAKFSTPSGPGQVSGSFQAGEYAIMREFTKPRQISYQTSCLASINKTSGNLTSARICDARQMKELIKSMKEALDKSHESYIIGGPYAFGNDYLTSADLGDLEIKSVKISGSDKLSCGVVNLMLERDKSGNYKLTGTLESGMPWCNKDWPSFFLGLINPDKGMRGQAFMTYAFEEGSSEFSSYLDELMDGNSNEITGYTDILSEAPSTSNWYTIRWLKISSDKITEASDYAYLDWVKEKMDSEIVGFTKYYPESLGVNVKLSNSYILGVVYDPSLPKDTVGQLAKCFVANFLSQQMTGKSNLPELNGSGSVVPLDSCKMPDLGTLIQIPSYNFTIYDISLKDITGDWTRSNQVVIRAKINGEVNIDYCYLAFDNDRLIVDENEHSWNELSGDGVSLDTSNLEDGEHTVKMVCKSESGILGPVVTNKLYIDRTSPSITGPDFVSLPLGLGKCCKEVQYSVTEKGSGIEKCQVYPAIVGSDGKLIQLENPVGSCNLGNGLFGNYNVNCPIGSNDWNKSIYDWTAYTSDCVPLPQDLHAIIKCRDKVGNVGNYSVHVVLSGSLVEVTPVEEETCPILTGEIIEEKPECLFSPAAKVDGVYYTNSEEEEELCFNVLAATPDVACSLTITNSSGTVMSFTLEKTGGDIHDASNPAVYCTTIDLRKLQEGVYNVAVNCVGITAEGTTSTGGTEYKWVGQCDQNNAWNGECTSTCEETSSGEGGGGGGGGGIPRIE